MELNEFSNRDLINQYENLNPAEPDFSERLRDLDLEAYVRSGLDNGAYGAWDILQLLTDLSEQRQRVTELQNQLATFTHIAPNAVREMVCWPEAFGARGMNWGYNPANGRWYPMISEIPGDVPF